MRYRKVQNTCNPDFKCADRYSPLKEYKLLLHLLNGFSLKVKLRILILVRMSKPSDRCVGLLHFIDCEIIIYIVIN